MFLDISVENFRSIKEKQTLSFEATKDTHLDDYFVVSKGEYRILRSVSILGANASGKSNVIGVFPLLRSLVLDPAKSKNEQIEFDTFALDTDWKNRDTLIETNFLCGESKYQYSITFNNKFVRTEELRCKPFGSRTAHSVFQRTTDEEGTVSTIKWGEKYASAEARKLDLNLIPNVTVFGSYQKSNVDLPWMKSIVDWFDNVLMPVITPTSRGLDDYTTKCILDQKVDKAQVVDLLKKADVGIDNIEVKKESKELPKELVDMLLNDDLPVKIKQKIKEDPTSDSYEVALFHKGSNGSIQMDFDEESKGTQRYYSLSGILLQLVNSERVVAIDELDYRLHPDLFQHFVNTFLVNQNGSQMVYTTHNREFLNDRGQFRFDAVYFTEKSDEGATELYSLADFDTSTVRNTTNVLNAYKAGRLGAIPRLGSTNIIKETSKVENNG